MSKINLGLGYYPNPSSSRALGLGQLYVGEIDTDPEIPANQKTVTALQESGVEVELSQPISLSAGGVPTYNGSPVSLFTDGEYSLKVLDSNGSQIYYVPRNDTTSSYFVDTVAILKASSYNSGVIVQTKGYYSAGDGGHATYLIQTAAEYGGTPDEYGDHTLANGNIAVILIVFEANLKQFGATGDGTTSDTEAIQATLDYCMQVRASDGADPLNSIACYGPSGVYVVDDTLYIDGDNFVLFGSGRGTTVFKRSTDYGNTFEVQRPRDTQPTGHTLYGITLKDFTIESTTLPTSGSHIEAYNCTQLWMEFIEFKGAAHRCVDLYSCGRFRLNTLMFNGDDDLYDGVTPSVNSAFIRTARNGDGAITYSSLASSGVMQSCGIRIGTGYNAFHNCYWIRHADGIWMDNCYAKNAVNSNYHFEPFDEETRITGIKMTNCWGDRPEGNQIFFGGTTNQGFGNSHFSDCRFYGATECNYGIIINAPNIQDVSITNCFINDCQLEGIDCRDFDEGIHIRGNTVSSCNRSSTSAIACVNVDANLSNFEITDNRLGGDGNGGTGNTTHGVRIESGTSANFMIRSNNCLDNSVAGIIIGTGASNFVCEGNLGSLAVNSPLITADTTISVNPQDKTVRLTGTTAVTSITASWDGHEITLMGTDAVGSVITDGSNLRLAGNFTLASADTLKLVCNGTNWLEVSRSTN